MRCFLLYYCSVLLSASLSLCIHGFQALHFQWYLWDLKKKREKNKRSSSKFLFFNQINKKKTLLTKLYTSFLTLDSDLPFFEAFSLEILTLSVPLRYIDTIFKRLFPVLQSRTVLLKDLAVSPLKCHPERSWVSLSKLLCRSRCLTVVGTMLQIVKLLSDFP